MDEITKYIQKIVEQCEEIQKSDESDYSKEYAKKRAYDDIKEIVMAGGEQNDKGRCI